MTAPLPPRPDIEQAIYERCRRFVDLDVQEAMGVIMRDYAKLAVHEALERAAVCAWSTGMNEHTKTAGLPCDARTTGSRCAEAIRAMIEEYK